MPAKKAARKPAKAAPKKSAAKPPKATPVAKPKPANHAAKPKGASKPAPKAAPKASPKSVPAKASLNNVEASAAPKPVAPTAPASPAEPLVELEALDGREMLCHIEILKDGHFFIARTQADGAAPKEYKNTVFEDMLTEMVITLAEQMTEK